MKIDVTNLSAAVTGLSRFWSWWTRELKSMLPKRLRPWLLAPDLSLLLYPEGNILRVHCQDNDTRRELGSLALDAAEDPLPAGLAEMLPSVFRITLCWPADQALVRSVTLPGETRERLGDVIGFELDRLTPFRADQAYFHHRLADQDPQANTLEAEIRVVPRAPADALIGALARRGLQVSSLVLDPGDPADAANAVNLAPSLPRSRAGGGGRRPWILAGSAVALLALALAIPQVRDRQRIAELEQLLSQERAGATAASNMRDELRAMREEGERFARRRAENPTLVETLDELSRVMPDSTWLSAVEIRKDLARLQGLSDSASGLIAQVESSALFRNAEFTAPVTRDPQRNLDQFVLEARISRREGEP